MIIEKIKPENEQDFIDMQTKFSKTDACEHIITTNMAKKNFEYAKNNKNALIYIIKKDNEIAGYAYLSFAYSTEIAGICLYLEELYIKKEHRGGVGKAFLKWLLSEYKGKVKRIRLEVTKNNLKAKWLYKKNGFIKIPYDQMYIDMKG